MAQKRRVLFVGEASFTATGFGTYYQELLKRLYQMGDLELAEIGCYVSETDPRCRSVPWKFYPVVPHPDDEEGNRIYNNDVLAQFGKAKFDEACLDFKPDIVCVRPTCRITYFDAKKNCRKTKYAYNVQVGDMVLTHKNRYMPVTEVMRRENDTKTLAKIFIESGGSVSATREHPILASKEPSFGIAKWTPMIDIEVGDYVFYPLENGEYEVNRVSHKKLTGYIGHVHNFSVAEDNSYVADGIIVHNCDIRDEWMSAHILFSPLRNNYKYCFDGDTTVLTPDNHKKIRDIKVGDMVLTSRGKPEKVVHVSKTAPDKPIRKITVNSWLFPIICTEDHKFLVIKHADGRIWDKNKNLYWSNSDYYNADMAEWTEAKDIKFQDIMIYPREVIDFSSNRINILDYIHNKNIEFKDIHKVRHIRFYNKSNTSKWIPQYVNIDNDLARLFGYFISDGCSANNSDASISFCFGKDESEYADDVLQICKTKFKVDGRIKFHKTEAMQRVTVNSKILKQFFRQFYTIDGYKHIPDWLYSQSNDILLSVLIGMIRGDGCCANTSHDLAAIFYYTNSKKLMVQLWKINARLGLICNIDYSKPRINKLDKSRSIYKNEGYALCYLGEYGKRLNNLAYNNSQEQIFSINSKHRSWFDDHGNLLCQVHNSEVVDNYSDHVYDISVENDHSFLTPFVAHNCWLLTIDGIPQREKWLDEYRQVDNCLTYSKWAMNDVMKTSARPGTNMVTIASPGVDLDVFKPPLDKKEHKAKLGIHPESLIVGCLAKDTPVLMGDWSWKPIQDIVAGEKVIDAEGNEQFVEATHIFEPNKPIVDIKVVGEPEKVTLTHDHEILAVRRDSVMLYLNNNSISDLVDGSKFNIGENNRNKEMWRPQFIEPALLSKGDFWAFKIPNKVNDVEFLTLSEWADQPQTSHNKLPEKIYLTEGFLKFIGLYLANGSIHDSKDCEHHSIEISTNTKNIDLIESVVSNIRNQFSLETHVRAIGNETQLAIHNVSMGRLMYKLCGKYAHQKKLHPLFNCLHPTKQLSIVVGYQSGDGHLDETGRNHAISVNRDLLVWMRLALLRNGVVSHLYKRNMKKAQCYANARQQWRLSVKFSKNRFDQFIYNGYLYSPIKSVESSEYADKLYDLTIANSHSYVSFLKGLHNTVMRCQPRKLYYDLIEAFGKWVYKNKSKGHLDLVNKTFLYLHTSYPDVGYDIGRAVQEFRVGNRVLMTYLCQACGSAFPAFFAGALTSCRNCHKMSAMTPNAMHGVPRNVLADIMKSFDMYVQYSTAEGYAMPLADSLACGVPVAALDHSAMKDHLESPHAMPIRVGRYFYEPCNQTEQKRALPDNDDFIQRMDIYLRKSYEQRMKMSKEIRDWTVELVDTYGSDKKFPRSSWDRTAEIWKNVLLSMPIHNRNTTWDDPSSKLHVPQMLDVSKMNNKEFVNWVLVEIYDRPELADTYYASEWITALNMGYRNDFNRKIPTDRNSVVQHFMELNNQYNLWENRRLNNLQNIGKQEVFDVL